jgi:CheY-like chemotaxis protein
MVELLGGEICFEPQAAGGSHFWFAVPYEEVVHADQASAELAGVRVLLADRDPQRHETVARQLDSLGLRVTSIGDPAALAPELASARQRRDPYRIAMLGHLDAADIAATLQDDRSAAEETLLVVLTGPASAAAEVAGWADSILAAPFGRARLQFELQRLLGASDVTATRARGGRRGRLLLAEDDATNRLFAVDLLRREGWEVEVVEDGLAAVELALAGDYDAILMDCQMPKLDGYCATEQIRRRDTSGRHTPIIAVTAHATSRERERCLSVGMDGYVAKPFTATDIEDALARELGRPRRHRIDDPAELAGGAPADQEPLLDRHRLASTERAVRAELVALFLDGAKERLRQLRVAIEASDARTAQDLAHTLKGSAATIGAVQLDRACQQLQRAIQSGDLDFISSRQAELEQTFALTERALINQERENPIVQAVDIRTTDLNQAPPANDRRRRRPVRALDAPEPTQQRV